MAPEIYFPHLGIKITEINKIAFSLFGINIYWYGIIITSAIILGYLILDKHLKENGENIDDYVNLIMIALVVAILGARLYYVIFSFDYFKDHLLEIFNFRHGGIAIYGGIIGAFATGLWWSRKNKVDFGKLADYFAPLLVLGQGMGRWGNFINREAFGGYTDGLFAMALRTDTVNYLPKVLEGTETIYFNDTYLQVQPTFLYESVACIVIFTFLMFYRKHKKFSGEIFILYIMLYSLERSIVEGLRTDQLIAFGLPVSQMLALVLFVTCIIIYVKQSKKADKKTKINK